MMAPPGEYSGPAEFIAADESHKDTGSTRTNSYAEAVPDVSGNQSSQQKHCLEDNLVGRAERDVLDQSTNPSSAYARHVATGICQQGVGVKSSPVVMTTSVADQLSGLTTPGSIVIDMGQQKVPPGLQKEFRDELKPMDERDISHFEGYMEILQDFVNAAKELAAKKSTPLIVGRSDPGQADTAGMRMKENWQLTELEADQVIQRANVVLALASLAMGLSVVCGFNLPSENFRENGVEKDPDCSMIFHATSWLVLASAWLSGVAILSAAWAGQRLVSTVGYAKIKGEDEYDDLNVTATKERIERGFHEVKCYDSGRVVKIGQVLVVMSLLADILALTLYIGWLVNSSSCP